MTIVLTVIEEANLISYARNLGTTPESVVREVLGPILQTPPAAQPAITKRHISKIIADRISNLPVETFAVLPVDGATEHDHYLYGAPKKNQ